MKELVIRQAVPEDAEAIARLEKLCFSEPWSYDTVYHELAANRRAFYLAADLCGRLVGYAGLWLIGDEAISPMWPSIRRKEGRASAICWWVL